MNKRLWILALTAAALPAGVLALTSPKDSDGPVKLLGCVVRGNGLLEAQVNNQSDDAMYCNIRCDYELADRRFSHTFSETIPKRFQGTIATFDTNNAKPGNYTGEIGTCKKSSL